MKNFILISVLLIISGKGVSQTYPVFGPEKPVEITGLSFDAMEPFLSPDGNTLFFNSLNSGGNTNLYYSTRVNDTVYTYQGLVAGCHDTSANHLDGVASVDENGNFFWVSFRDYPNVMQNLRRGNYSAGSVTGITSTYGDFNIPVLGWIIMDAAINSQGNYLVYCNAYFDFINSSCGAGVPCSAGLGIAEKTNDSTFTKLPGTDILFAAVNDTSTYLTYAPQLTNDGLELYFTRLQKGTYNTEICVSVRNSTGDAFSVPGLLYSNYGYVPEAPTLSSDMQRMYYHRKDNSGLFHIFIRYRSGSTNISDSEKGKRFRFIFDEKEIIISGTSENDNFIVELANINGQKISSAANTRTIDISQLPAGTYVARLSCGEKVFTEKFVVK